MLSHICRFKMKIQVLMFSLGKSTQRYICLWPQMVCDAIYKSQVSTFKNVFEKFKGPCMQ